MGEKLMRIFMSICGSALGYAIGNWYSLSLHISSDQLRLPNVLGLSIAGAMTGYLMGSWVYRHMQELNQWLDSVVKNFSFSTIMGGTVGAVLGLLIANLVIFPMLFVVGANPDRTPYISIVFVTNLFVGYIGLVVGAKVQGVRTSGKHSLTAKPKVLDSSVLIDGRIVDIVDTGFIEGKLIVPDFILQELRLVADSQDSLRRSKGRRGLDVLRILQEKVPKQIEIAEVANGKEGPVDDQLLQFSKERDAWVVTNDYNLNKHASVTGIAVLNINDLANAVKSVVLPGEELNIRIMKEGKEDNQGVGYLVDGTMVVVENARRYIGKAKDVTVTNMLQSPAGRVIFAKLA